MRKLVLTCTCGQRMLVPRSAVGKMGLCPSCGKKIHVTPANTGLRSKGRRATLLWKNAFRVRGRSPASSEEAKQRFGQAVDLFYAKRYAEALAVFDSLAKQYPGNPEIESGRAQCLNAMSRPALSGPDEKYLPLAEGELNVETIRSIVLDKMLHGSRDEVQLHAAELACKLMGIAANGADLDKTQDNTGEESVATGPPDENADSATSVSDNDKDPLPTANNASDTGPALTEEETPIRRDDAGP